MIAGFDSRVAREVANGACNAPLLIDSAPLLMLTLTMISFHNHLDEIVKNGQQP